MIFTLLKNYYRAAFKPLEYPKVVQFPVNDICNSRCQMCNIWKNKKSPDIDLDQVREIFSQDLFRKTESIGINGGEPTLRKDLPDLVNVLYETMPKLKTISLISNGFNNKDIKIVLEKISKIVTKHNGYFEFMLSLDGYKEIHDEVRGKKGNFERIEDIIDHVKKNGLVDNFRVGCTVTKPNVLHLHDLYSFCLKHDIYLKYRLGIPHQRLYTLDKENTYDLTSFEKYEFAQFLLSLMNYENNKYQIFFYKSLFNQLIHGKQRTAGCDWQHRGATVTSKGELLYCAVESPVIETLDNVESYKKKFFESKSILKEIKANKCDNCNHDYTGLPNAGDLFSIHFSNILSNFKSRLLKIKILEELNFLRITMISRASVK